MTRIAALPKVELHLHIEGTLEPELVFELARENGIDLPYRDAEELRARYAFDDLQSFLEIYYENLVVLRGRRDFARLAHAYATRAHAAGVVHAEVFFDPQAHTVRGVTLTEVVDGLMDGFERAHAELGITTGLIACFLRDRPVAEALSTLDELLAVDAPIIGVGLDSAEVGNPASRFTEVFDRASRAGLRLVAHAGEEGGPDSILQALDDLAVERVDHGIRSVDDPRLMSRLADERTPLTICPLSNVHLNAVADIASHPLPELIEAGLHVTINSDDPAYFGGYVDQNYAAIVDAFDLDDQTVARLAHNSVDASFLDTSRQQEIHARIDEWLSPPSGGRPAD
ncbi:adenosine deaminase [Gordonia hankookensis]|uniref:Adenine deaminase n=1 Tax=Gordonia hankookensis TaxID=589403 RepID=A0ABR7WDV0_9ACTN|nr:adenosine deaminase [Gordonia hankookensis]MBD1320959.1 adenosine deaminase [Gordonia hankookensis]